jgi:hypothetical protein
MESLMDSNEYLKRLKEYLTGFSSEEREALIEEIASHIEEGETDPHFSEDMGNKIRSLECEMGSPRDLGRAFKDVYRPTNWIEYLLVVSPYEILKYPLLVVVSLAFGSMAQSNSSPFSSPYLMISIRASLLLFIIMVLVSQLRRSLPLYVVDGSIGNRSESRGTGNGKGLDEAK